MFLGQTVRCMNGQIAFSAENRTVLSTEDKSTPFLADIAERRLFVGRAEREARVLGGKLVGVVDFPVAAIAESGLVCTAEH